MQETGRQLRSEEASKIRSGFLPPRIPRVSGARSAGAKQRSWPSHCYGPSAALCTGLGEAQRPPEHTSISARSNGVERGDQRQSGALDPDP